jgi:5-methyltetrahydrofolate--homocysteine methyltransferase
VPEQSEHLKVEKLLHLGQIGMTITDGYAPEPEQSTLALVAHHPQAIYFGTRQGRLLPDGSPDDVIRGSNRDPSLFGEIDDGDPPDGVVEGEDPLTERLRAGGPTMTDSGQAGQPAMAADGSG